MATYSSATQNYYTLQLTVTESEVDTANNRSKLLYSLILKTGSTYFSDVKIGYTIKIDGTTVASLNYSSATAHSMDRNSSWTIYSSTCYVSHNSDGTKSIASGQISASLNTQTGNIVPNLSLSNSSALALTTIPRESTVTTSATSTLMGVTNGRTITVTRKNTSYAHTITYTFGSASGTIATKTTSESISWTVPKSLAAQVEAGAIRASGTITCTTYASTSSSTVIGTPTTCSFLAQIPPTEPTVTSAIASFVTMGNAAAISLTGRAASNLSHKLTYNFNSGAKTGTVVSSTNATSYSWTVPTSLAQYVTAGTTNSDCVITCTTYNGTASVGTKTVTLNHVYIPKSTFTVSGSPVTVGTGSLTINITRCDSSATNLTHTIQYSADNSSWTTIVTRTSSTSYTWSPGYAVAADVSGTSATWYIRVLTYNYSSSSATGSIGNNSATFTIKIVSSDSTKPVPTASCASSISSGTFSGLYIQGNSTLTVSYSGSAANNGASSPTYYGTLASYTLKVGGTTVKSGNLSATTMSGTYTSGTLSATGSVTVALTLKDNHGFSATHTQTITVQAYTAPSLGPKSGGATKIVVGRCDENGTLTASGTYLHIECSRTISQIQNTSNTQVNYGYLHYSMDGTTWTAIGSGSTAASADGTVAHANIPLAVDDTYQIRLRTYDTFGGTAGGRTITYNIPTDTVFLDTQNGSTGLGVGMYSQGASRLDIGWSSYFARFLYGAEIASRDDAASGGKTYTRLVPAYDYTDLLGGTADSYPYGTFFEAWLKQVVTYNPQAAKFVYWGAATPNGSGIIMALVLDSTALTNGLPNYSGGVYIPNNSGASVNRGIVRFGSYAGAFYVNKIPVLESSSASVSYVSNSIITSSSNLGMTLRKSGNVVTLDCQPTFAAVDGGTTPVTVATLPSGYLPQSQVVQSVPGLGSSSSNYMCSFYALSGGDIRIYKHSTSTATYRANLTWIVA